MEDACTQPPPPDPAIRSWRQRTRWHRRAMAHLGIQGKLVLCFMSLLSIGLGSSCWMFIIQGGARLNDMMGEQTRQIAYALALAGKPALSSGQTAELKRIGQDLLKARNILFVAYLDTDSKPLSLASRDPDLKWTDLLLAGRDTQQLMKVQPHTSAVFGDYMQVVAPILSVSSTLPSGPSGAPLAVDTLAVDPAQAHGTRLLGYVAVGLSQTREQAQMKRINALVIGIGCLMAILSFPLAYALVYRVFQPIRQLVQATNRIAAGDLDAQVAIHRPDVIGILARAFNEMVKRVKQQQEDLADANRGLEEKVLQRTSQLETANKRLSSEIAEKEDFLRAVSHDLNAPLRNISGMASMLLMKHRERFDEDIIHRLERIQKNVQAETDLISELLELSRIKTRRQKMDMVELNAVVHELEEMFENDLKSRQIDLILDQPLPVLQCERARLRQVFQNLIDNAIKYMGEGSTVDGRTGVREIHVGCTLRHGEAEFHVRDTGMGIDEEDLGKVFFVFRRGKNGVAQNVTGKGVGLASVKSIIETYRGSIWVESRVGQGSTFRFTINGQYVPSLATGPRQQPETKTQPAHETAEAETAEAEVAQAEPGDAHRGVMG